MTSIYIDSCIYLNIWKKEKDEVGNPLWKTSTELLNLIEQKNIKIFYSGFIFKELLFILTTEEFLEKTKFIEERLNFEKCFLSAEEFSLAKEIYKKFKNLSLYDSIHLILTKKTNSILVSRDKLLLDVAKKNNILAMNPEETINYLSRQG